MYKLTLFSKSRFRWKISFAKKIFFQQFFHEYESPRSQVREDSFVSGKKGKYLSNEKKQPSKKSAEFNKPLDFRSKKFLEWNNRVHNFLNCSSGAPFA